MRRTAVLVAVVLTLVAATGCGDNDAVPPLLLLPSTVGLAVVDGGTGQQEALLAGSASTPDGRVLFESTFNGSVTSLVARSGPGLEPLWRGSVAGPYEARVADADGTRVVLGPNRSGVALTIGTLAPGRTETPLVILEREGRGSTGSTVVTELTVAGNIEPEGFSLDGDSLFVVRYLPPEAPTYYQVKQLDLASGELHDVTAVHEELQRDMRGTARVQTWDPDGDRLYTLYTLDGGGAFVHVLDLDEEWAHCVDLPLGIGASTGGMALSSDGRTLYVADAAGGQVAEVDTEVLAVSRQADLPADLAAVTSAAGGPDAPTAVAVDGRRLLVGRGGRVAVLDRGTFEPVDQFLVNAVLVGLQVDGDELYVARRGSVVVLDADTGEERRRLRLELPTVLSIGPTAIPTYAGIQCAC